MRVYINTDVRLLVKQRKLQEMEAKLEKATNPRFAEQLAKDIDALKRQVHG